jgi:hypothetical protein
VREEWRSIGSCWLPPLSRRIVGIVGSSTLVSQRTKYYLEYKVRVYLWCWVLKKSYLWSLYSWGFIVRPRDGYSSRRAQIKTNNPCMRTRVVVNSIDVVSRLEATFIYLISSGWGVGDRWWQPCPSLVIPHVQVWRRTLGRQHLADQVLSDARSKSIVAKLSWLTISILRKPHYSSYLSSCYLGWTS